MTELTDAIYTMLAGGNLGAYFPGGLWYRDVPDGTLKPYLVYHVPAAPTDPDYGTRRPYDAHVQFTAIGQNARTTMVALEQVRSLVDSSGALTLSTASGRSCFNMLRDSEIEELPSEEPRDEAAERLYGYFFEVTYSIS